MLPNKASAPNAITSMEMRSSGDELAGVGDEGSGSRRPTPSDRARYFENRKAVRQNRVVLTSREGRSGGRESARFTTPDRCRRSKGSWITASPASGSLVSPVVCYGSVRSNA